MPRAIADFSVGHSAVGSVAETSRMLAPLAIEDWMTGSWEAEVAAEPLVSLAFSSSVGVRRERAAGLHTVGDREVVVAERLRDDEGVEAGLQRTGRARGLPEPELLGVELVLDEPHAAIASDATATAAPAPMPRIRRDREVWMGFIGPLP